jgi:hypothetical protein
MSIERMLSQWATVCEMLETDGLADDDLCVLTQSVTLNLMEAQKARSQDHLANNAHPLLRAVFCLGKFHERMDTLAGDRPGVRCKNREMRNEIRNYREVAREMVSSMTDMAIRQEA